MQHIIWHTYAFFIAFHDTTCFSMSLSRSILAAAIDNRQPCYSCTHSLLQFWKSTRCLQSKSQKLLCCGSPACIAIHYITFRQSHFICIQCNWYDVVLDWSASTSATKEIQTVLLWSACNTSSLPFKSPDAIVNQTWLKYSGISPFFF